jgi:hypothetical protein
MRQILAANADLARKLDALEQKYDAQFKVVFDAIRQLMAPPPTDLARSRGRIGFPMIADGKRVLGNLCNERIGTQATLLVSRSGVRRDSSHRTFCVAQPETSRESRDVFVDSAKHDRDGDRRRIGRQGLEDSNDDGEGRVGL